MPRSIRSLDRPAPLWDLPRTSRGLEPPSSQAGRERLGSSAWVKSPEPKGLTATQWTELVEALWGKMRRVIQEPGWQVAAAILGLWQEEPLKAGNCLDPDEEAARQQLEVWLQAWKVNPERPREMLDLLHTQAYEGPIQEPTLWPDAGDTRVGGRSAKDQEDRKLVTPCVVRRRARPLLCECRFARGESGAPAGPDGPGGSA